MPENYRELDEVIVRKQDEQLEQVLGTIENIKGQTLLIGGELTEQIGLMEGLQGQMEQTDSLLARATKRVEAAYAAALDRNFTLVTSILAIVLILLFVIIIAT